MAKAPKAHRVRLPTASASTHSHFLARPRTERRSPGVEDAKDTSLKKPCGRGTTRAIAGWRRRLLYRAGQFEYDDGVYNPLWRVSCPFRSSVALPRAVFAATCLRVSPSPRLLASSERPDVRWRRRDDDASAADDVRKATNGSRSNHRRTHWHRRALVVDGSRPRVGRSFLRFSH